MLDSQFPRFASRRPESGFRAFHPERIEIQVQPRCYWRVRLSPRIRKSGLVPGPASG